MVPDSSSPSILSHPAVPLGALEKKILDDLWATGKTPQPMMCG